MPSRRKFVVGRASMLAEAIAAWQERDPDVELHPVEIGQDDDHGFDLAALQSLAPAADASAFVAWDEQFLNFRRQELMGMLKERGFSMPPLVCPGAIVAANATLGENAFVGRGAILEAGVQLGYNSVIGAGSIVGAQSRLGNSVWLGRRVTLGDRTRVGANTTLDDRVNVASGVEIGRLCVLAKGADYRNNVTSRTYHLATFALPVTIVGA